MLDCSNLRSKYYGKFLPIFFFFNKTEETNFINFKLNSSSKMILLLCFKKLSLSNVANYKIIAPERSQIIKVCDKRITDLFWFIL